MTAYANVDLALDQYADFRETYFVVDDDGTPSGAPRQWATLGATATLEARLNPIDPLPVVSISTTWGAQGNLTMANDGSISIVILKATITSMPLGVDLGYDLVVTVAGVPIEVLRGAMRVRAGNDRS